jgi:hypothetical protein
MQPLDERNLNSRLSKFPLSPRAISRRFTSSRTTSISASQASATPASMAEVQIPSPLTAVMNDPPKKATSAVFGNTPSAHPARKPGNDALAAPNAMFTTMNGADGTLRIMKLA